jgi:hypothetical protein
LYVVKTFRTVGLAISEGIWLIRFECSGCDGLLIQAAFLLDVFQLMFSRRLRMAWPRSK